MINSKKGFSLIELIITIIIISILAVMAISIFSLTSEKSRDAKRKVDLDTLKKALEQFKADTKTSAYFPKEAATVDCNETTSDFCIPKTALIYEGPPEYTYLKKIPNDPQTKKDYYYKAYLADGTTSCTTPSSAPYLPANATDCAKFIIVACLENPSDPKKDTTINTSACGTGWKGSSYTVKNN